MYFCNLHICAIVACTLYICTLMVYCVMCLYEPLLYLREVKNKFPPRNNNICLSIIFRMCLVKGLCGKKNKFYVIYYFGLHGEYS